MDGQKALTPSKSLVLIAAFTLIAGAWPAVSFAQAMGKVAVDAGVSGTDVSRIAERPTFASAQTGLSTPALSEIARPSTDIGPPIAARTAPAAEEKTPDPRPTNLGAGLSMPDLPSLSASSKPDVPAAPLFAVAEPAASQPAVSKSPETSAKPPAITPQATPAAATSAAITSIEHRPIRPQTETAATSAAAAGSKSDNHAEAPPATSGGLFKGLGSVLQVGAALAIVLGLVFIGRALAKKFLPAARTVGSKGVIEILAKHPLSKNQQIVLVRIGSQIVALNQGKESSESVLVISEPTEVARIIGQIEGQSPKSIQSGFTNLLANARMDLERGETDDNEEPELRGMNPQRLDEQLEEMAAAKRQLMELRQHVRSVRDSLPRS